MNTYTKDELYQLGKIFCWICDALGENHPTENVALQGQMYPLQIVTELINKLRARGTVPRSLDNRITLAFKKVNHIYTEPVPLANRADWFLGYAAAERGLRLVAARKSKKMTQVEVAKKLDITQQALCRWETAETSHTPESVKKLESLLGKF